MAIATANANAPSRRMAVPVATVQVVGATMEIRNAKVGVVWMAMAHKCADSQGCV